MKNVLLIGHDANRAGAQLVLLNLMRLLKARGLNLRLLLGEGGPLLEEYESVCPVTLWPQPQKYLVGQLVDKLLFRMGQWERRYEQQLQAQQRSVQTALTLDEVDLILVNTVSSSQWFGQLGIPKHIPVVTFAHELDMSVRMYTKPDELAYLLNRTAHLLAVSKATARYYEMEHGYDPARITLFTLIDTPSMEQKVEQAWGQSSIYEEIGLPADALVVGGCGNAEWRKGNDLFISLARQVIGQTEQPVHFVWVGMPTGSLRDDLLLDIRKAGMAERVHLIPPTPEVLRYVIGFDVFVLCSREDPYPLVVFEAGLCRVPVVCFDAAGGAPELVEADGGFVVPYLDLRAMADRTLTLLAKPELRHAMGHRLDQKIRQRHPVQQSVETLLQLFSQVTR